MSTRAINPATDQVVWIDDIANCYLANPTFGYITQGFGVTSVTGVTHKGFDISVATGTPIKSVDEGVVSYIFTEGYDAPDLESDGSPGGYGNQVRIAHDAWLGESRYAHLSRVDVRVGQYVYKGEVVGLSGTTGISSGPHLHVEVRDVDGWAFDGQPYVGQIPEDTLAFLSDDAQKFYESNLSQMKAWAAVLRDANFHAGKDSTAPNDAFDKQVDRLARLVYATGLPQDAIEALPEKVKQIRLLSLDLIDAGTVEGFP